LRLYRNLVLASIKALEKIFIENQLADRVVQTALRSNKKWGSKDRRFIAKTVYDMVRWYRLYYEIYGQKPLNHADWWGLLGVMWYCQGEELPDWEEWENLDQKQVLERFEAQQEIRKVKASIPDWLDELGDEELGKQWEDCLAASNKQAALVIRTNTLKTKIDQLQRALDQQNIATTRLALSQGLVIRERKKITASRNYQKGDFEVQDASSQQVAPYLDVEAGMTVVDACAGAGGKSLHLAALMKNRGQITSLDIEAHKLEQLRKRAKRANASIIKTQVIQNINTIKGLYNSADRLLLDVPCSGLGTLRRSPHIKWRLKPSFLDEIRATQQHILQNYTPICKVGGQLVYATCSILPSENRLQVDTFLNSEKGQDYRLLKDKAILPQDEGFDGFYMALLERIG